MSIYNKNVYFIAIQTNNRIELNKYIKFFNLPFNSFINFTTFVIPTKESVNQESALKIFNALNSKFPYMKEICYSLTTNEMEKIRSLISSSNSFRYSIKEILKWDLYLFGMDLRDAPDCVKNGFAEGKYFFNKDNLQTYLRYKFPSYYIKTIDYFKQCFELNIPTTPYNCYKCIGCGKNCNSTKYCLNSSNTIFKGFEYQSIFNNYPFFSFKVRGAKSEIWHNVSIERDHIYNQIDFDNAIRNSTGVFPKAIPANDFRELVNNIVRNAKTTREKENTIELVKAKSVLLISSNEITIKKVSNFCSKYEIKFKNIPYWDSSFVAISDIVITEDANDIARIPEDRLVAYRTKKSAKNYLTSLDEVCLIRACMVAKKSYNEELDEEEKKYPLGRYKRYNFVFDFVNRIYSKENQNIVLGKKQEVWLHKVLERLDKNKTLDKYGKHYMDKLNNVELLKGLI